MKNQVALMILAVALAIAPVASAAPLDFTLAGTLDASHYAAGASAVAKIRLLSIDYQGGTYRFQLLDSSGAPYGGGNIVAGGNLFASTSTGRVGYLTGTGAGTAVTQLTSRTTAVTSNTPCGAITLFTAAGSATPASFTVNCTAISAGDTVQYAVTSGGTNQYHFDTTSTPRRSAREPASP